MGALALTARSKEHISLATVFNGGGVHQQRAKLGCTHCEDDHQGVVDAKGNVAFASACGYGEIPAFVIALQEGAGVAILVDCQYLVCTAVLAVYLELCAWARECAYLAATPRRLYVVVNGYAEQQVVRTLALKRCEVGQY